MYAHCWSSPVELTDGGYRIFPQGHILFKVVSDYRYLNIEWVVWTFQKGNNSDNHIYSCFLHGLDGYTNAKPALQYT